MNAYFVSIPFCMEFHKRESFVQTTDLIEPFGELILSCDSYARISQFIFSLPGYFIVSFVQCVTAFLNFWVEVLTFVGTLFSLIGPRLSCLSGLWSTLGICHHELHSYCIDTWNWRDHFQFRAIWIRLWSVNVILFTVTDRAVDYLNLNQSINPRFLSSKFKIVISRAPLTPYVTRSSLHN
jgi:hypothetical protein